MDQNQWKRGMLAFLCSHFHCHLQSLLVPRRMFFVVVAFPFFCYINNKLLWTRKYARITSAHKQTLLGHVSWFYQSRVRRNIWWIVRLNKLIFWSFSDAAGPPWVLHLCESLVCYSEAVHRSWFCRRRRTSVLHRLWQGRRGPVRTHGHRQLSAGLYNQWKFSSPTVGPVMEY